MSRRPRRLPALALVVLVAGACGPTPVATPSPSAAGMTPPPLPTLGTEVPFEPIVQPATGSWCDLPGAAAGGVRIGAVEAVDARTVRFSLCGPDAAFPARLADPVAGVIDAASVTALAADPELARYASGAGLYRVEAWLPGENVRLSRVADEPTPKGDDAVAMLVLRWDGSSAARTAAIADGTVDAIDDPAPAELDTIASLPELVPMDRQGMATAYLGFGYGQDFAPVVVRRAFGQALDREALASAAFPAGSTVATHVAPCEVPFGCEGDPWYESNAPAAAAALDAAKFDRGATYPLFVPSEPVPGVPDPAALGEAIRAQLAERLDVTVEVTPMAPADLAAALAEHRLRGLYVAGIESRLADASGFLDPLFGRGASGIAAYRAGDARADLATADATVDQDKRAAAFAAANDAIRAQVPVVPIAHAGSTMVVRDDVEGAVTSPLSEEPLGRFVPGDRHQLVLMQAAEPQTAWCGTGSGAADRRLCGLVTPGLLVFRQGSLDSSPGIATRCTPDGDTAHWTCRLRASLRYSNGAAVDAGDVVASLAAQADPASDLRAALPPGAFAGWDALFGAPVSTEPGPSPTPASTPGATPASTPRPGASAPAPASPPPTPEPSASQAPVSPASASPGSGSQQPAGSPGS